MHYPDYEALVSLAEAHAAPLILLAREGRVIDLADLAALGMGRIDEYDFIFVRDDDEQENVHDMIISLLEYTRRDQVGIAIHGNGRRDSEVKAAIRRARGDRHIYPPVRFSHDSADAIWHNGLMPLIRSLRIGGEFYHNRLDVLWSLITRPRDTFADRLIRSARHQLKGAFCTVAEAVRRFSNQPTASEFETLREAFEYDAVLEEIDEIIEELESGIVPPDHPAVTSMRRSAAIVRTVVETPDSGIWRDQERVRSFAAAVADMAGWEHLP